MIAPSLLSDIRFYVPVVIIFLVMISVLVFAHELGHYLFARLFGMGVEEFAIGFGPKPLWVYHRRHYTVAVGPGEDPNLPHPSDDPDSMGRAAGMVTQLEGKSTFTAEVEETPEGTILHETTEFTVRPLPLGGFVRIKGMLPYEDGSEVKVPGGFYSKAPWKRLIVLFAGPLFSVLAGIAILVPYFMAQGVKTPDPRPILGIVLPDKPADRAHLKSGDMIVAINGQPVTRFYEVIRALRDSPGQTFHLTYNRDGKLYKTDVVPEMDTEPSYVLDANLDPLPDMKAQAKIGTAPEFIQKQLGVGAAFVEAVKAPYNTVVGIFQVFQKVSRFDQNVNGPVRMVKLTGEMYKDGIMSVMFLAAMLSISVGIFNLLPVPPLDGGQMAIAFTELLRGGRRLSIQVQSYVSITGLALIVLLMSRAIWSDISGGIHHQATAPAKISHPAPPSHPQLFR